MLDSRGTWIAWLHWVHSICGWIMTVCTVLIHSSFELYGTDLSLHCKLSSIYIGLSVVDEEGPPLGNRELRNLIILSELPFVVSFEERVKVSELNSQTGEVYFPSSWCERHSLLCWKQSFMLKLRYLRNTITLKPAVTAAEACDPTLFFFKIIPVLVIHNLSPKVN